MQILRNAHLIARFVLVWFALSLGVAVASPMVNPQVSELVCSGTGGMKLIVVTDDGANQVPAALLDCPLCAISGAPPSPQARVAAESAQPLGHVLHSIPSARIAAFTAAPLPARGPPSVI